MIFLFLWCGRSSYNCYFKIDAKCTSPRDCASSGNTLTTNSSHHLCGVYQPRRLELVGAPPFPPLNVFWIGAPLFTTIFLNTQFFSLDNLLLSSSDRPQNESSDQNASFAEIRSLWTSNVAPALWFFPWNEQCATVVWCEAVFCCVRKGIQADFKNLSPIELRSRNKFRLQWRVHVVQPAWHFSSVRPWPLRGLKAAILVICNGKSSKKKNRSWTPWRLGLQCLLIIEVTDQCLFSFSRRIVAHYYFSWNRVDLLYDVFTLWDGFNKFTTSLGTP